MPVVSSGSGTKRRGRRKRQPVAVEQLTGRSYLRLMQSYLTRLNKAYPHPNRILFFDDVLMAHLMAFFNPTVRSLRTIEDASQIPALNRFFNVPSVRRSTLSDANSLFDPELAQGLIAELRQHLPARRVGGSDVEEAQLRELLDQAILVDGSFFRLAADVAWAVHVANQHTAQNAKPGMGTIRLNLQLDLSSGVPIGASVNGADGVHEATAARAFVEPNRLYVFDGGIVSFDYLRDILAAESHFACNLGCGVKFTAQTQNPLSEKDRAAGVVSDTVGRLPGSPPVNHPPDALVREVIVTYTDRSGQERTLRLLTDLLALPAWAVAELYRKRWQIELFFRWLKVHANFTHLCSHSRNGITLGFEVMVIAAMLMVLRTGTPLSKYSYNLMSMVAAGLADVSDVLPILERRERENALARARLARKKAQSKTA